MSSRPLMQPFSVITNGDMSQASLTSIPTIKSNMSMVSYGVSWAGTAPVGTVTVQVSNDYSENADGTVRHAGTWTTLVLSAPTNVSGNTGNGFIDVVTGAYAIRLVYTRTSGTGVLQVIVKGQVT
jgi:hypothetical protein